MATRKTLLILRNSAVSGQWSMWNSADYIARATRADFDVQVIEPPVVLSGLALGPWRKYALYFDIYVLAAIALALRSRGADLVVAVDQGYAPAMWLTPRRKRTAFVHDTIAIRQAKGWLQGAPPVGRSGRLYQAWILAMLKTCPVLAVNTQIEAEALTALGVTSRLVEVGQPAAAYRLTPSGADQDPPTDYFLNVGLDLWVKNKAYLVEVYGVLVARTAGHCPDLVLAGTVAEETLTRVQQLNLADRVKLVPSPDDGRLGKLLQGCVALLMPSKIEGFGVPPMEALLFGKPVLLSDIPVFRQIYGSVARFFPLEDAEAAAGEIAAFLADDAGLSESARLALLERYSIEAVGARTRDWLSACLPITQSP